MVQTRRRHDVRFAGGPDGSGAQSIRCPRSVAPCPLRHRDLDRDGGLPTEELLRQYAAERDPATLEQLVVRFAPLVRKLALRYVRAGEPLEDLEQVGSLGLVKAIDRFDPERGFAFTSFAVPTILGEIKRSIRDTAWSAHVPRAMQERVAALRRATDAAAGEHGRAPTVTELAERLGWDPEDVVEAMSARPRRCRRRRSTHPAGGDGRGRNLRARRAARRGGRRLRPRRRPRRDRVGAAPCSPTCSATVLDLRFVAISSRARSPTELGCSQMQISRVLRGALERLSTVAVHRSQDSGGANTAPRL